MNKKWFPHIIAVWAFAIFILLGQSCVTLTPEEQAERDAARAARQAEIAAAREGFEALTVLNRSQNLSITQIQVRGITDPSYTRSYQVNLRPATNAVLGGGSFDIGEDKAGKKMVPIGEYEVTLLWSNNGRSTHRMRSNSTLNITGP